MKPAAGLGARGASGTTPHVRTVSTEPLAPGPATALDTDGATGGGPAKALVPSAIDANFFGRMRESVWLPIAGKALAILAGMLALAAVGAWSTLQGSGVPLALASGSPVPPLPSASSTVVTVPPAAPPAPSSSSAPPPPSGVTADGRVILNLATAEELTRLPRVGAKRAENIVALRKKLGRFKQPADLLRVKGIGRKTLQLMLPKLVLDPPRAEAPPAPPP